MVGVPFTDPHSEQVDILIKLIKEGDRLNDHVVHTVNVEFDLSERFSE